MEFHQLRYFVAAAEELSITAAAKRMHVSQPALSRQIATLEDDLGFPLFDRVRQRIHLTEAGRFFLPKARQILCDAETSVQQLREQFGKAKRTIRLGFLMPFLDDLVAPSVKALRLLNKQVEVSLFELTPRAQLDRLRDGELDLAILGNIDEADLERFGTTLLMMSRMAVVLPDDHKLAGRKQMMLTELAQDSFVSLSNAFFPGRRHFLWSICHSQGFEPKIVEECDSLPLLLGAVSSGLGVALLPMHSRKLPHAGCVFISLKTPVVHAEVLAVHARESAKGAILRLLHELQSAADGIVDGA